MTIHRPILPLIMKYFIIFAIILNAFTIYAYPQNEATLVKPSTVEYFEFYDKFTAIGQCKSENSKTYYAKTNGVIDYISVSQGSKILKDDILLTIDKNIAKAQRAKAEASFEAAEIDHNRNILLAKKKIINSEVLDKSKVTLNSAKADLILAQDKYNNMIIRAPYDGYVGVVKARIGDDIKLGDYLFSIIADGEKTVFVELPENMFSKINLNSIIATKNYNGEKIKGKISAVSNYLNDNGTITAKASFPSESKLIHGSYIELEIIFNQHTAISVPEKTILKNNNGNFVYKITEDNKIKQIYIKTGSRTSDMIEIISGDLKQSDLIVLSGLTKVNEGSVVKIIEDNSDSDK